MSPQERETVLGVPEPVRALSLALARYCTSEVSTLAKQGCIAAAVMAYAEERVKAEHEEAYQKGWKDCVTLMEEEGYV